MLQFKINTYSVTNELGFSVKYGNKINSIDGLKVREERPSDYDSINRSLSQQYFKATVVPIQLIGYFETVAEADSALINLFYYACVAPGEKTFTVTDLTSSVNIDGVVKEITQTKYKLSPSGLILEPIIKVTKVT